MASIVYNSFWDDKDRGNINVAADTFYRMLVTSAYVENKDTHTKRSDVTGEVATNGSYAAGGVAVVPTITKDTANDRQVLTFPAVTLAATAITARKEVIYKRRGGAAGADELVLCNDFGSDQISSGGGSFSIAASTITLQN